MRALVEREGLADEFKIDSAGTAGWHAGNPPDARMREAASRRGIDMKGHARQVAVEDFSRFDHIFAMDRENHAELLRLRERCPNPRAELHLFCEFCEEHDEEEVPDPYYGGPEGFEKVLDLLEDGCAGFLRHCRAKGDPAS